MNLRRRTRSKLPKAAVQDATRMQDVWLELLGKHDGPYLFNDWSIADAFATPYASRFVSYGIDRNARADTYISELMSDDDFLEWEITGLSETWKMPDTDAVNT
jgi:glutathione S-transferase